MFIRLWDQKFSQAVDSESTDTFGIKSTDLMERAGTAVARHVITSRKPELVIVLAGPGNNGGDALVAARLLQEKNFDVHTYLVNHRADNISKSCAEQLAKLKHSNMAPKISSYQEGAFDSIAGQSCTVIDGVLGLGFSGKLKDGAAKAALLAAAKLERANVIAIDLPSGMDADITDGQDIILKPKSCITFGGLKPAHVVSPARSQCGKVYCEDIGFSKQAIATCQRRVPPYLFFADEKAVLKQNPWDQLSRDANKFDRGHVLVIGGSKGKIGAPQLSALAALRSGAGWASIAFTITLNREDFSQLPLEATFESFFENNIEHAELEKFLAERKVKAIVIGPGCVEQALDVQSLKSLAHQQAKNGTGVVLDAGCLHNIFPLLEKAEVKFNPQKTIFTPHPGEWLKLGQKELHKPTTPQYAEQALQVCEKFGISLLYKSATPILFSPDHPSVVVDAGTQILARAGSGDVLAGVIAAHLAIGTEAPIATIRAQLLIAAAAQLAAKARGEHAVLASDLIDHLGKVTLPN